MLNSEKLTPFYFLWTNFGQLSVGVNHLKILSLKVINITMILSHSERSKLGCSECSRVEIAIEL